MNEKGDKTTVRKYVHSLNLIDRTSSSFDSGSQKCLECGHIAPIRDGRRGWLWYECRQCGALRSVSWASIGIVEHHGRPATIGAIGNERILRKMLRAIMGKKVADEYNI